MCGSCPEDLARRNPGNLSHARWLTLANRVLRLYVATQDPSIQLCKLAEFVLKVYAPSWFSIKRHPSITSASENFFNIIQRSQYLDNDMKAQAQATLQRNAFMAHPESLLLGMLFDPRKQIRLLALKRIIKSRKTESHVVRTFTPPEVNFEASDYIDLIDWQSTAVTQPPLISDFSTEELQQIVETGKSSRKELTIPAHTQAVERIVKEVTAASKQVCGEEGRDGYIRARLYDREILPKFETKKQFKPKPDNETDN